MKKLKIKKIMNQRKNIVEKGFLLIFISTLLSTALSASERSGSFSLTAITNKAILLQLPDYIESSITISLSDMSGNNLHQEELLGGTIARKYNLNRLPSGEYIFQISFDQTKKWKRIKIVDDTLQTIEEDFHMIIEPTVQLNDRHLDLNFICFSDSKVSISIWDENGHLLSENFITANGSIEKRYNLTNLKRGRYQLYISSTDPSIDFEFTKRLELKSQKINQSDPFEIALNK